MIAIYGFVCQGLRGDIGMIGEKGITGEKGMKGIKGMKVSVLVWV